MSEEGIHWLEHKQITDESKGGAGFISKVSADGGAVRVVWQHTIGGEKGGVFHPDGWESGMPRHFKLYVSQRQHHFLITLFSRNDLCSRPRGKFLSSSMG